jgi:hypothetical protein
MESSALANRPLPSVKEGYEIMYNKKGNPVASQDVYNSDVLPIHTNFNEKEKELLPISIEQSEINNNFMVVEGHIYDKVETVLKNDKRGIITNVEDKYSVSGNKMNFATTFYVGSLTVIGLFVFYRLIQKTR